MLTATYPVGHKPEIRNHNGITFMAFCECGWNSLISMHVERVEKQYNGHAEAARKAAQR